MAMRWLEGELRKNGDIFDKLLADQIADRRELRGDIPFPSKEIPVIHKFTEKSKDELASRGFLLYELTGQSISSQRDKGLLFFSTWHQEQKEIEEIKSRFSEVAIDPNNLFIPGSNDKTFLEQSELVRIYNENLQIPDVEAVIGEVPDYTELALLHLKTEFELFGKEYSFRYAVTQTQIAGQRISVGHFLPDEGIVVNNIMSDRNRREQVFVAPIVVPA